MKDITISKCKINFIINPRIELLSVIQIMAGENEKDYKEWYANNEFYITEIKKYFNDYKNHPAIKDYRKYYINNYQIAKYNFNNNKSFMEYDSLDDTVKEYFLMLNDFIEKSNYEAFFNKMEEYYRNALTYNIDRVHDLKIIDNLSDYYNSEIKINVIFKMVQGDWGEYISDINNEFAILCGISKINEYPVFIDYKQMSSLCFHECTHPFVNKYLTNDYNLLAKTESLFIDIDENSIARQNYFTYNEYLEDLVVRAITSYMHFKYQYSTLEEYYKELEFMEEIGFVYIKDITNILEKNDFYTSMNVIKRYLYEKSLKKVL